MAAGSLLALLDDIASVLDDVALLTKVAGKKTAGVLGDDIALNAQQVSGVVSDRELPVVWAVAKGSFINKLIIVPAALAISAFFPVAIVPLLMIGGLYLCYEGVEKVVHSLFHHKRGGLAHAGAERELLAVPAATEEKTRIRGAVRTDFILSAEIVAITLGTVAAATLITQTLVVSGVAIVMTIGVYGLVAGIVKLDDVGLYLSQRKVDTAGSRVFRMAGAGILAAAPWLMKGLSLAGTIAMFLVGGGILVHGIPGMGQLLHDVVHIESPGVPGTLVAASDILGSALANATVGALAGGVALGTVKMVRRSTSSGIHQ